MKRLFILALCTMMALANYAVSNRQYIKNSIEKWGSCRNVAITDRGGAVALNYSNQYSYSGIPSGLSKAIKELHDQSKYIDDIQLTERGEWLILYGDNGFRWSNIPSGLEKALREYNEDKEVVTCATFNDSGDWIIISTKNIRTSDDNLTELVKQGMDKYGQLWCGHFTEDGLVLCFENGFKFQGNVPQKLKDALGEADFDVYRIKFTANGSYFFADKKGHYTYWM